MAFRDFTYPDVLARLGLTERIVPNLFAGIPPLPPTPLLRETLDINLPLALAVNTEFARAGLLIFPVLSDVWRRYGGAASLYSGSSFSADPDDGLNGYSDFLLGRGPQREEVSAPVVVVAEAKNQTTTQGLGQCIAGMVGAWRFNRRHGTPVDVVYGCSTTGTNWKFLRLTGTALEVDFREYLVTEVDRILGILTHMVGPLPGAAAA
jgi:hypothetical protein